MKRRYYSLRTGKNQKNLKIDLEVLKNLFKIAYEQLEEKGYFQEHFGYCCVDDDGVGKLGSEIAAAMLFHIRKENLWPILANLERYSEDDLFDVIEFLYDHVSKPLEGYFHNYAGCGYHYRTFDTASGRNEYRQRINEILETYRDGFELSELGEILECAQPGMAPLLVVGIPSKDQKITIRIEEAISKFRRYRSTIAERRDAIRDLADVLEYIRPQIKSILKKKDENDLFKLANNFGIRHHNQEQKTDYDNAIWLSWMFYFFLSTIHACLRMIDKHGKQV